MKRDQALELLTKVRADTLVTVRETLPALMQEELDALLEDGRAAQAAMDAMDEEAAQAPGVLNTPEKVLQAQIASCKNDLATRLSNLESASADSEFFQASVATLLTGLRSAYTTRIEALEADLATHQKDAALRNTERTHLVERIFEASKWKAVTVEERIEGTMQCITMELDRYIERFIPFADWVDMRTAIGHALRTCLQLNDVIMESRMAIFMATRDYFRSVGHP
jgi:hypothetical protein